MKNRQFSEFTNIQHAKHILFSFFMIFLCISCYSQKKELTWEELREQFECPKWFSNAGFGIWAHWGAQAKPESGGGWYARHMYMQDVGNQTWGRNAYEYHCKTYGHPSEKG